MALQTSCRAINGLNAADARAQILAKIKRIGAQIEGAKRFLGPDLALVVFPEYSVTGFPWGEDAETWKAKAAFAADGPEYAAFAKIASDCSIARAGTGEPVHWIAEGGVYEYPSGKKLLGMTGFDTSTVIWPSEPGGEIFHLTRKTFAYTDAVTGEMTSEFKGKKVEPIAYPYQVIRYRIQDGRIHGDVEQGTAPRIQKIKSETGIVSRRMGDTWAYTAQVYLDFPLPGGKRYQVWENHDFWIHPGRKVDEPHHMS